MIKKITVKGGVLRKGYVRNKDGIVCHKTVLERYFDRGYLDMPNSCFSAEDRKNVGKRLAQDYYLGLPYHLKSVDFAAVNIPTTGECLSDSKMFYHERYLCAMESIPREFREAVRRVCLDDKKLICDEVVDKKSLKNKNCSYHQKMLLNMGLERLIEFYLKKNKKSS